MTMKLVSTLVAGVGGVSTFSFTSIPQTGTDLLLVASLRSSTTGISLESVNINFNGGIGNSSGVRLRGSGSAVTSDAPSTQLLAIDAASSTASTFGNAKIYIPNYTSTSSKTFSIDIVTENNGSALQIISGATAGDATSSAITQIDISNTTFVQYSSISLYTITKGSGGATVA